MSEAPNANKVAVNVFRKVLIDVIHVQDVWQNKYLMLMVQEERVKKITGFEAAKDHVTALLGAMSQEIAF